MDFTKETLKLQKASVGNEVETYDLYGNRILVGVHCVPHFYATHSVSPCLTCAFGNWRKDKIPLDDRGRRMESIYTFDNCCPMFKACNAKDRPDNNCVNFTKANEL